MVKMEKQPIDWITVNGNHVPIFEGQSKKNAISSFIKDKSPMYKDKSYTSGAGSEEDIKLPDEQLPKSVGARWVNEIISMPDGTSAKFVEGSKITNKQVFVGKGCKRKIDEVERLVKDYVGSLAENWQKVKGNARILLENGEEIEAEIHWYQEENIRRVEYKFKKEL